MHTKSIICLLATGAILSGCAEKPHHHDVVVVQEVERVELTATEQALLTAVNTERRNSGMTELTLSPTLTVLARGESNKLIVAGQLLQDTTALNDHRGFGQLGKLQGTLKDRGPQTGAGFVKYWAVDQRDMLLGDWRSVGVGISKSANGELFAVLVVGRH